MMHPNRKRLSILSAGMIAFAGSLAPATHALAAKGVLEINQTCAVESGCFPGDSPGFPVTINGSAPARSFTLTSDLSHSSLTASMIQVSTSRVTLDLAGFSVSNSVSGSGTADVISGSLLAGHVVVRNGTVRGGGGQGIDFSGTAGSRIENVPPFE